jgi:hypothetical protein
MPLAEVQRALAHLYTDENARARLRSDPADFARRFALGPADLAQISPVPAARFHAYADSLDRKRANECVRMLPVSARAAGPRFRADFLRYARSTALGNGVWRYRDDAVRFAAWLSRGSGRSGLGGAARALLGYESSFGPGVACYRYFVPDVIRAVTQGEALDGLAPHWTLEIRLWPGRRFVLRLT